MTATAKKATDATKAPLMEHLLELRGRLIKSFVALIAASMSTFDSHVNKAASFFTKDFYQGLARPKASRVIT